MGNKLTRVAGNIVESVGQVLVPEIMFPPEKLNKRVTPRKNMSAAKQTILRLALAIGLTLYPEAIPQPQVPQVTRQLQADSFSHVTQSALESRIIATTYFTDEAVRNGFTRTDARLVVEFIMSQVESGFITGDGEYVYNLIMQILSSPQEFERTELGRGIGGLVGLHERTAQLSQDRPEVGSTI